MLSALITHDVPGPVTLGRSDGLVEGRPRRLQLHVRPPSPSKVTLDPGTRLGRTGAVRSGLCLLNTPTMLLRRRHGTGGLRSNVHGEPAAGAG